jgi:hypothetical protein
MKIYIICGIIAICLVLFFTLSKKENFSPNLRPIISSQDNCSKCSTKYTKYSHNNPLNSDGQIIR